MVQSGDYDGVHAGVVFVSQHRKDVGDLVRRIDATLERNADSELTDEILFT